MPYIITGNVTFASQANRDAAITRVNTALSGMDYTDVATTLPAGINTSGTLAITISIQDGNDGETARTLRNTIYNALVQSNRHTLGWVSVNKI